MSLIIEKGTVYLANVLKQHPGCQRERGTAREREGKRERGKVREKKRGRENMHYYESQKNEKNLYDDSELYRHFTV